ncbi:MAG TPA: hypothetical protein VE890_01495 [Thermoguttaceae bacterium]|nr:hypothetical protein [Thermoguttaceae bacterium]
MTYDDSIKHKGLTTTISLPIHTGAANGKFGFMTSQFDAACAVTANCRDKKTLPLFDVCLANHEHKQEEEQCAAGRLELFLTDTMYTILAKLQEIRKVHFGKP